MLSNIFSKLNIPLFTKKPKTENKPMPQTPDGHVEIDWSNWSPPSEGDVRSPCPFLNVFTNHHILPHTGKGITKATAVKAMTNPNTLHLSPIIASALASGGVAANPDPLAHSFDLDHVDKHNFIEHDGSLSRNDAALGSNSAFCHERWKKVFEIFGEGGKGEVSYDHVSKGRYARIKQAKAEHEQAGKSSEFEYGIQQAFLSYGETALWMNLLGKDGVVPLEHLRVFFEEERMPYAEGWRPKEHVIDQSQMNEIMFKLIAANENKLEEAEEVGLGTVKALEAAIANLVKMPNMCSVM